MSVGKNVSYEVTSIDSCHSRNYVILSQNNLIFSIFFARGALDLGRASTSNKGAYLIRDSRQPHVLGRLARWPGLTSFEAAPRGQVGGRGREAARACLIQGGP